jgi:MoaA/NifB/PqqE/SkfB family radical SAM enzyme
MKEWDRVKVVDKLSQHEVVDYLEKVNWDTTSKNPLIVEFDPTTNCNLACPDCISGELLNKDEFSDERVITLTKEMVEAGVKGVILIGGGEPMAHSKISEVIQILGENQVSIGITTNGLYLKKYKDVTSKYVDWVRVSVDAATSKTFQRIRPSRTGESLFDSVIKNMEDFAKNKQAHAVLGYSFMVFSEGNYGFKGVELKNDKAKNLVSQLRNEIKTNVGEIYQAALLAKNIGCAYFEVKPMYDIHHFSVMQRSEIADVVEEQIDKCKTLQDENFRILVATKLFPSLRGESNLEPKEYKRCASAQVRTLITPSGAYVCPYFRGVEHKKIGDLNTNSFENFWNGPERKNVIDKLDPSIDCPMHCIRNDTNIAIEQMIKDDFSAVKKNLVPNYDIFI